MHDHLRMDCDCGLPQRRARGAATRSKGCLTRPATSVYFPPTHLILRYPLHRWRSLTHECADYVYVRMPWCPPSQAFCLPLPMIESPRCYYSCYSSTGPHCRPHVHPFRWRRIASTCLVASLGAFLLFYCIAVSRPTALPTATHVWAFSNAPFAGFGMRGRPVLLNPRLAPAALTEAGPTRPPPLHTSVGREYVHRSTTALRFKLPGFGKLRELLRPPPLITLPLADADFPAGSSFGGKYYLLPFTVEVWRMPS